MQKIIITSILCMTNAYGITLPKEAIVFNEYREPVDVKDLTENCTVTVLEGGAEYEATIYNLSTQKNTVSFEVVDYTELNIAPVINSHTKSKHHFSFSIKKSIAPLFLLGLSALPTTDAAGICYAACITGCYAACAALSVVTASPACLAVANAGGCPLACAGAAAIPLPWC
ncbi:MAG: hypothetical protein AB8C84_06980 [Oligoflexales bacterium]